MSKKAPAGLARQLSMLILPRSMWKKKKKKRSNVVKTYYMGKPHGIYVDGRYYKP